MYYKPALGLALGGRPLVEDGPKINLHKFKVRTKSFKFFLVLMFQIHLFGFFETVLAFKSQLTQGLEIK